MNKFSKFVRKISCILLASVMVFSNVNVANAAEEADKQEEKTIGSIDIKSIKNYVEKDGWSYDPKTKTLTLAGVNMNAYKYNCKYYYTEDKSMESFDNVYFLFNLYPGTTVIVKEGTVNNLFARVAGGTFDARSDKTGDAITIKGGGTLNLYGNEAALLSTSSVNIEDVNINMSGGDGFAMLEAEYSDVKLTLTRCNLNIDDCTGAIYNYGNFGRGSDINSAYSKYDFNKNYTSSVLLKDSTVKMNVKLDTEKERNHSCFLLRNGYLDIDNSTLDLTSYHEAVNVWRGYKNGAKDEPIIRLKNVKLQDGVEISSDVVKGDSAFIKGETFVNKGDKLDLSFDRKGRWDLSFGHYFKNGLKHVTMTRTKAIEYPKDDNGSNNTNGDNNIDTLTKTIITSDTDKSDIAGSKFTPLCLKAKSGKKKITLSWKKVKEADSYVVFGSKCGTNMEKIATVKDNKYVAKKLKKGKYYKYIVVAVKGKNVLAISKSAHCVTKGGKYGNPTKLIIKKSKLTIKKGKSKKVKTKLKVSKKTKWHISKYRYESSNSKVATVNKKGKIKAKSKGKCSIYVYAQNGIYKRIKVTVK